MNYVITKNNNLVLNDIKNILDYDYVVKINSNLNININKLLNETYFGSYDFYSTSNNNKYDIYPQFDDNLYIISKKTINILLNNNNNNNIINLILKNNIIPKYDNKLKNIILN